MNGAMAESLRGRLLAATPALADTNFSHAVVYLLDHTDEGALGVVLNRPSDIEVSEALPQWDVLAARPGVVFVGGPVQPEAVVALGQAAEESEQLQPVGDGVGIVDLRTDPLSLIGRVAGLRLFAGYAGWGAGQLEAEIAEGGWFVVDAASQDVFADRPDELWLEVLTRQGGLFRTISDDPTLN
jgi:putative transcriptional regulator